jgi:hypothetical protein
VSSLEHLLSIFSNLVEEKKKGGRERNEYYRIIKQFENEGDETLQEKFNDTKTPKGMLFFIFSSMEMLKKLSTLLLFN